MKPPLDELLKIPAGFLEMGLTAMDGGIKAIQTAIETLAGQNSDASLNKPPLNGPQNLDDALSDFANQLVRIGRRTRPEAAEIVRATRETFKSAQTQFWVPGSAGIREFSGSPWRCRFRREGCWPNRRCAACRITRLCPRACSLSRSERHRDVHATTGLSSASSTRR